MAFSTSSVSGYSSQIDPNILETEMEKQLSSQSDSSVKQRPLANITGIPSRYFAYGWFSFTRSIPSEDAERRMLYRELRALTHEQWPLYAEILTKILVKKPLYHTQGNPSDFQTGLLVPAPKDQAGNKQWYVIEEILDTGLGKFAYKLAPATQKYNKELPDLLLYRSSATLPTSKDCFSSYLTDFNCLPPGYLARRTAKEVEKRWIKTSSDTNTQRPLCLIGHSLGGSHIQLALHDYCITEQTLPRPTSCYIFDSPALAQAEVKQFANWTQKQNSLPLELYYYVSDKDPVPAAGALFSASAYLGNGAKIDKASVQKCTLTKEGKTKPSLTGLGPHARIFFRGKQDQDYTSTSSTIADFDKSMRTTRRLVVLPRLLFFPLVWLTIGSSGLLKRCVMGRRNHQSSLITALAMSLLLASTITLFALSPSVFQSQLLHSLIYVGAIGTALGMANHLYTSLKNPYTLKTTPVSTQEI